MGRRAADSIESTKKGFEESFQAGDLYDKQTQDEHHLIAILNCLKLDTVREILDLGTGTGYLAFPIAERNPDAKVYGLDIVEAALRRNREKANALQLRNLQFVNYDGLQFPFKDEEFDLIVSRYALHHFPVIADTFQEIYRVLRPGGRLFIADPAPNDLDTDRFVDAYMQMKKDGHIKFYTLHEWQQMAEAAGLMLTDHFETWISFPRKRETAIGFEQIMRTFDKQVICGYHVELNQDDIWITEQVNNVMFQKDSKQDGIQ